MGAEKEEFRTVVRKMARDPSREVNFEEALREAHLVWADGRVSEDVRAVLDRVDEGSFLRDAIRSEMDVEGGGGGGGDGSSSGGGPEIPPHVLQFQLLVLALKRFLSTNDDYPPLEGTIPDMTSDTARYVALQEAYRRQAERDWSAVREIVGSLLGECERRRNGCDLKVAMPTNDEVQTFCKNSRYLRILETRPLFYEYELQDPLSPIVASLASTLPSSSSSSPSSDYAPLPDNFYAIQLDARDDLLATTMDPHENGSRADARALVDRPPRVRRLLRPSRALSGQARSGAGVGGGRQRGVRLHGPHRRRHGVGRRREGHGRARREARRADTGRQREYDPPPSITLPGPPRRAAPRPCSRRTRVGCDDTNDYGDDG